MTDYEIIPTYAPEPSAELSRANAETARSFHPMMGAYGPRPAAEHRPPAPALADNLAHACLRVSRAADGRTFACARPAGHDGAVSGAGCYGRDRSGAVRLGFGR